MQAEKKENRETVNTEHKLDPANCLGGGMHIVQQKLTLEGIWTTEKACIETCFQRIGLIPLQFAILHVSKHAEMSSRKRFVTQWSM